MDRANYKYPMNYMSKFRKNTGRKNEDEENLLDKKRKYKDLIQKMWIKVDPYR